MRTKKDITPLNKKKERHGYWEAYYANGKLMFKGNFVNGIQDGYWKAYAQDGTLLYTGTFLNGKRVGFWTFRNNTQYFYAD